MSINGASMRESAASVDGAAAEGEGGSSRAVDVGAAAGRWAAAARSLSARFNASAMRPISYTVTFVFLRAWPRDACHVASGLAPGDLVRMLETYGLLISEPPRRPQVATLQEHGGAAVA